MKNMLRVTFMTVIGIFLLYIALLSLSSPESIDKKLNVATLLATPPSPVVLEAVPEIDQLALQDNLSLYQFDDPSSIVYMYITIRKGNPSDNTNHTWGEVNDFTKWLNGRPVDVVVGQAEAILQIGDESGPLPDEVGYGETLPNATIQIRGNSTSAKAQKSYKIELRSRAGVWRGQSTINLNKQYADTTRARNKLTFDLIKQIPNMVSLRTQFVRLFVKDETTDPPKITFVDYGLFTQIEQPNKKFLRSHLLDPDGQLYKATFFEFHRYPDQIRLADDPLYDEKAFSKVLEIKGNNDHAKLIQMLDDVNDENIPIEKTFEKYFNADNYFTWLAFNILVGNVDTQSQNFFLYSPKNGIKWYFLPWDYDGDLYRQSEYYIYDYFEHGISNYWGVPLHSRVLKVARYRQMLDAKINELRAFLTPERLEGMLKEYKIVTDAYSLQMPDLYNLPATVDKYNKDYQDIPGEIQVNYDLYLESLNSPQPYFLGTPQIFESSMIFNWDEAYAINAQSITYHLEVSRDWDFREIVYDETISNLTTVTTNRLEPGIYFWRVKATNEDGITQYPFDVYRDAEGFTQRGMKYLFITDDGEVLEE
jgi:spore coat protein H